MWKIFLFTSFFVHYVHCECQKSVVGPRVYPLPSPPVDKALSVKWDDCTQSAYYVQKMTTGQQPSIFRYDNNADRTYSAFVEGKPPGPTTFIVPINKCMNCTKCNNNQYKSQYLVSFGLTAGIVNWDGMSPMATYVSPVFQVPTNDPTLALSLGRREGTGEGRFYTGTAHITLCSGASNASFYQYSREKGLQKIFTGTKTTFGTTTDIDAGKVYNLDGCTGLLTSYDLDKNGNVCNGRVVTDLSTTGKLFTGLDIDENGQLYSSSYTDGSIIKINPRTGSFRTIAQLPVAGAGGLSFGGENRKTLFVVAGSTLLDPVTEQLISSQSGPSLYKIFVKISICFDFNRNYSDLFNM